MANHARITLTKDERAEIKRRIRAAKDRTVADRLRVILYKADGRSHEEIAQLLQVNSINTITNWLHTYLRGGLDALCSPSGGGGSEPHIDETQQAELALELRTNIYNTAEQVIAWVKKSGKSPTPRVACAPS